MRSMLSLVPQEPSPRGVSLSGIDALEARLEEAERQLALTASLLARKQRECDELADALAQQAHRDALTGLFNRRKFDALCEGEIARHARYGASLALIMLDIDHFKDINDRHGHLVGDDAIVRVVRALVCQLRATDALCRWGGEEFMVLAPHLDLSSAMQVAGKLCAAVAETEFGVAGRITCSAGVTALQPDDRVADMVLRADTALYRAKRNGRNRVEAWIDAAGWSGSAASPQAGPRHLR